MKKSKVDFGQCVQCGYCCTVSACAYGHWNPIEKKCLFLTEDNKCQMYDTIVKQEKDEYFPMMGTGCSSLLFNLQRDRVIKIMEKQEGVI